MKFPQIRVEITHNQLSDLLKEEMWKVYHGYYHYEKAYFLSRFERNTHYALYWNQGTLVGFTGLRINQTRLHGKPRLTMYFGQTVLKEAFRGKNLMQKTGMRLLRKYWKEILLGKAYWWADALTFRAYLAFARSTVEHFPNWKQPHQPELKEIVDFIGETNYPDTYDPSTGTVLKTKHYVADPGAQISPDCEEPDILYFKKCNPLHSQGHGLITMAPVSWRNLLFLINRVWIKSTRRKRKPIPTAPSVSSDSIAA